VPRRSADTTARLARVGLRPPDELSGDRAAAWLAAQQHGVVALRQLREAGLGRGALEHRIRCGRLLRVHTGVVAVGHLGLAREGEIMAALLATGDDALAAGRTASTLWEIVPPGVPELAAGAPIDVVVADRNPGTRPGVRYRRSRTLRPQDVRWQGPIPLTSPARTILDEADSLDAAVVERLLAQAYRRRLTTESEVARLAERVPGRRGLGLLLELSASGPAFDRSVAERLLLELVRRAGLPEPQLNVRVGDWEVDARWPACGVVAEFDSFTFHQDRFAFAKDRRKWTALQAAGHPVVLVVWEDLVGRPELVAVTIARALAAAGSPR